MAKWPAGGQNIVLWYMVCYLACVEALRVIEEDTVSLVGLFVNAICPSFTPATVCKPGGITRNL